MNELSIERMLLLLATFLGAGMVKGVTGMGLPTVAMGVLGTVMPPVAAAALLVVPSFVTNLWQWIAGPAPGRVVHRLWPMMLGIVGGTIAGSAWLVAIDPAWSSLGLGAALMAYAGQALLRECWSSRFARAPSMAGPRRIGRWRSSVVGVATGIVTGATGVFVIPAVPYLQSLRLDKDDLVQALGLSFTVSTIALAAGLAMHGAFRVEQLGLSSLAIVPALAGMWLGQKIRNRIGPRTFRLCFLVFLLLLGLELVSRSFL